MSDEFLTTTQVAKRLGKSAKSVRRMLEAARFPNAQQTRMGEAWRVPVSDVEAYIAAIKPKVRRRAF